MQRLGALDVLRTLDVALGSARFSAVARIQRRSLAPAATVADQTDPNPSWYTWCMPGN